MNDSQQLIKRFASAVQRWTNPINQHFAKPVYMFRNVNYQ